MCVRIPQNSPKYGNVYFLSLYLVFQKIMPDFVTLKNFKMVETFSRVVVLSAINV